MDAVNLVCTLNGALCYTATRIITTEGAIEVFDDQVGSDRFVTHRKIDILETALTRRNNPTIPQRALPVACHLPSQDVGMLELGCSRGDIGLVLLNLPRIISNPDKYLFPAFTREVPAGILRNARPISNYLGVDLDISLDDAWLLALWGLRDERRTRLASFYADFHPVDSHHFRRIQADACVPSSYINQALDFFRADTALVILTSFMVYQLSHQQRLALIEAVHLIQNRFKQDRPDRKVLWLDQGMELEAMITGAFHFSRCYLNRLWFEKDVLWGLPLARLAGDACEGWDTLEASPIVVRD